MNGYRSEGEVVSIKDYRLETHTCSEGDDACGQYDAAAEWHWNEGHAENKSYSIWKEDGTHDVTVFFHSFSRMVQQVLNFPIYRKNTMLLLMG